MKTFLLSSVFLIAIARCMSQQLECASCQEAPSAEECRLTTTLCGAGEECFLEKVTTTQLKVAYNAGCRSATVCKIMASLNQGKRSVDFEDEEDVGKEKRARNLVNCAECCNTALDKDFGPCNVQLCGLKANASKPVCLVCPGFHSGSNFCNTKDTCQDTQVCHTGIVYINGGIRYTYGCEDRHRCEAFIKNVNATDSIAAPGRRQDVGVHLCDACCTGNECNKEDCFALYKKMTLASLGIGNKPAQTNPPPATQPPVPITAQPATPKPTTQAPLPTTQAATAPPPTTKAPLPTTQAPPPSTQAPPPSTQAPPPSGPPSVAPTAGR